MCHYAMQSFNLGVNTLFLGGPQVWISLTNKLPMDFVVILQWNSQMTMTGHIQYKESLCNDR